MKVIKLFGYLWNFKHKNGLTAMRMDREWPMISIILNLTITQTQVFNRWGIPCTQIKSNVIM